MPKGRGQASEWAEMPLGDVLTLQRGFDITKKEQRDGPVPVVSSSGVASFHDEAKVDGPGAVIGRKGSHDTTLWVKDFRGNDPCFCCLLLKNLDLADLDAGSSNPTLNRNHAHLLRVRRPNPDVQEQTAAIGHAFDELIDANTRRIERLEDLAQSLEIRELIGAYGLDPSAGYVWHGYLDEGHYWREC